MSPGAPPLSLRQPLDPEVVERFSVERGEPDWLRALRLEAAERAATLTWPTGQEEEWRKFPPVQVPKSSLLGARAVTRYAIDGLPTGAFAGDLDAAVRERPDLAERWLREGGTPRTHEALTAVSDALWTAGTFVYVPPRAELRVPIVCERAWAGGDAACLSRTVVVADEDSSVTFVEEVTSGSSGAPRAAIPHLQAHLLPGASVRYVHVQRFGDGVWDLGGQWYTSARDSRLRSFNVLVGSSRTKLGITSDITGNGAEVKLYGMIAADDAQRIDVNSFQRLDGRASQSDLLYLSALYGSAKASYYGVIRVEKTSSGTGSYQECRNLLMSDKAGAHPVPVLEILTNDVVRCGHGATAGHMDEDEVFYVMSRGVPRKTAEQLLVRGSFSRVIDNIREASVRARVLEALRPRIGSVAETELAA